jgi:RNA-directed DNA polymerase
MIKAPIGLQELRRRIYHKAKSEPTHRFWGLFVHVTKLETLHEAYRVAKRNGGAAGIDGQTFEAIEQEGRLHSQQSCEKPVRVFDEYST